MCKKRFAYVRELKVLVLDEADVMLDQDAEPPINTIFAFPILSIAAIITILLSIIFVYNPNMLCGSFHFLSIICNPYIVP